MALSITGTSRVIESKTADRTSSTSAATLESFIRDKGGVVRWLKNAARTYGLKPDDFHAAIGMAKKQGYSIEIIAEIPCCFIYWKGDRKDA